MKQQYRLKKDTPQHKAGTLWTKDEYSIVLANSTRHVSWTLDFIEDFDLWFEPLQESEEIEELPQLTGYTVEQIQAGMNHSPTYLIVCVCELAQKHNKLIRSHNQLLQRVAALERSKE